MAATSTGLERNAFLRVCKMAIGTYIPSMNQTIKIAVALVIIATLVRVLPIPDMYKAYFRV